MLEARASALTQVFLVLAQAAAFFRPTLRRGGWLADVWPRCMTDKLDGHKGRTLLYPPFAREDNSELRCNRLRLLPPHLAKGRAGSRTFGSAVRVA